MRLGTERILLALVVVFITILYLLSLDDVKYYHYDSGRYMVLGKSLAEFNGFRLISSPGNPVENVYTPGYSLLLAFIFWFFKGNFLTAKILSVFFAIATLLVAYRISELFFDKKTTLACTLVFGLSYWMMLYSKSVLTESSYFFFSLCTLYFISKSDTTGKSVYRTVGFFFLAFSVAIKPTGMILSATVILYYLLKRNVKTAFFPALCIIAVILWGLSVNYFFLKDSEYTEVVLAKKSEHRVLSLALNAAEKFIEYFRFYVPLNVFPLLLYSAGNFTKDYAAIGLASKVIGVAVSAILWIGVAAYVKKKGFTLFLLYVISSTAIAFNWSIAAYGRHISPYLLFFIIYFVYGLKSIVSPFPMKGIFSRNVIFSLIIASMVAFSVLNGVHNSVSLKGTWISPSWTDFFETSDYLKKRCSGNEVILNNQPFAMYLETDCKTVSYYPYYEELPKNLSAYIADVGVTYVVTDDFRKQNDVELENLLSSNTKRFRKIYSSKEHLVTVYEVTN